MPSCSTISRCHPLCHFALELLDRTLCRSDVGLSFCDDAATVFFNVFRQIHCEDDQNDVNCVQKNFLCVPLVSNFLSHVLKHIGHWPDRVHSISEEKRFIGLIRDVTTNATNIFHAAMSPMDHLKASRLQRDGPIAHFFITFFRATHVWHN